jgi:crossover junction endodeoxyribonuclease RuvC
VRIFGIDPGSERTGYGCVETDGRRHHLIAFGAIGSHPADSFPQRLARIHRELSGLLVQCRPDCVAVESLFHAVNARSALKLGHARGVAILAAVEAGCEVVEYTPAEIKRAIVGYGRADKHQVQQMVKLLLGLAKAPSPHDAADALAIAICHVHSAGAADLKIRRYDPLRTTGGAPRRGAGAAAGRHARVPKTWRQYKPADG